MIALTNHLWQSTLVAAAVAGLAFALRRNRADLRYWLWLAASTKFLLPFAVLVTIGTQFAWRAPTAAADSAVSIVIDVISQPFVPAASVAGAAGSPANGSPSSMSSMPSSIASVILILLLAVWFAGAATVLLSWRARWRGVRVLMQQGVPLDSGLEVDIMRRLAADARTHPLEIVASEAPLEPGVFGIRQPRLLWPRSISACLTEAQIEAILAHELTHVRRRDNLAAALHMVVQAIFWFHPVVWWIGARLVDERERACDEAVLRLGSAPQVYAESILKTCEFYVAAPSACLSGVTGSDLRRRIEQIMRSDRAVALAGWRRHVLAAAALAVVVLPIAAGVLGAPRLGAQGSAAVSAAPTFAVASVKQNKSGGNGPGGSRTLPSGQFIATNITLRSLISNAYGAPLQPLLRDQLVNVPAWIDTDHFDIVAKAEGNGQPPPAGQVALMLRALLAERFNLAVHEEQKDLPIYALVKARQDGRLGAQIKTSTVDCSAGRGRAGQPPPPPPAPPAPGERPPCGMRLLVGNISGGSVTMSQFTNLLSRMAGRIVVDKTALSGAFDIDLQWTPDRLPVGPPPAGAPVQPPVDPDGPSIFTAVQEQLGLKLEPQTEPVAVVVVDRLTKLNAEDEFETPALAPPPPPPPPR
jgi:bla regulator protein BlaR1